MNDREWMAQWERLEPALTGVLIVLGLACIVAGVFVWSLLFLDSAFYFLTGSKP